MNPSTPSRNGEPLDKAEILKMADEITRVVDGGHHKAYGTNPYQTTMTAGNAWWRTVADAMRAYAQSETASSGHVPSNREMRLDMDVDDIKAAIGKAYPSIDDMTRDVLIAKLDRIHTLAYRNLKK